MFPISKRIISTLSIIFIVVWSQGIWANEKPVKPVAQTKVVIGSVGFSTPESVEYYAKADIYLVSNINGSPTEVDGNGFISRVKPDGSIIDLKWIDGAKRGITLNAPKGMAIQNNKLYVADINQIQIFDLDSGHQEKSVSIEGSTFLNGITTGSDGSLYVTNTGFGEGFDALYRVWPDGKYEELVNSKDIKGFNGILEEKEHFIVAGFGTRELIRIDAAGRQTKMATGPQGSLDGLVRIGDGRMALSSWDGSAIYAYNRDKTFSILADSLDAPADLGYDSKRDRLLIPLFNHNKVVLLSL